MVSFTELIELIKKNPTRTETLPEWKLYESNRVWRVAPVAPVAAAPVAAPAAAPVAVAASVTASVAVVASVAAAVQPPTFSLRPYGRIRDPLCIGVGDALYDIAPVQTAREIEKEEAIRLEALIPTLYSAEGGRSRGWTKKLLQTHLQSRATVGGDLFELQRAKLGFDWSAVFTCKETSALLDFICLAKGIRCVVWKDKMHFGLWPGADPAIITKEPPLFHILEGRLCHGLSSLSALFTWVDATPGAGWTPALCCLSILSNKTVAELEKDAAAVGITVTGKKSEQIVQIAAARRRRSLHSLLS
jgi:hypothetical protein